MTSGRLLVAFTACAVLGSGCAAEDIKAQRGPPPCPPDTAEVGVKDILAEAPPGMKIITSDPASAEMVNNALRHDAGDALRSIHSRVVANRGELFGTGVFVVNLDERIDPRDLRRRAENTADNLDLEPHPVTIAGEDAMLVVGPEGVVATGVVGDCSSVTVTGPVEAEVRAVAERIERAD